MSLEEGPGRASRPFPSSTLDRLLVLLLLVAAWTAWQGYRFGDSNLSIQVPLVKHSADPSLYPSDPLLQTAPRYTTWFVPVLGRLLRALGHLEVLYFVLFVLGDLLYVGALWALAEMVAGSPAESRPRPATTAAVLLVVFGLSPIPNLGGELTHTLRLTHTQLAFALLLWALVFALRGQQVRAYALAGLVVNLHALSALFVFALLALDGWVRPEAGGRRRHLRLWGLFLLLAAPTLIWALHAREALDPRWLELLKLRSSHHSFPSRWEASHWARYLVLVALAGLAVDVRRTVDLRLSVWAAAVATLCVTGFVFTEWWPVKAVLQAQPFRSTHFLTVLALALLARLVVELWDPGGLTARLAAAAIVVGLVVPGLEGLLVLALALVLLHRGATASAPAGLLAAAALVLATLHPFAPLVDPSLVKRLAAPLKSLGVQPLVALCLALFVLLRRAGTRASGAGIVRLAVLATLVAAVFPLEYRAATTALHAAPWTDVQLWVRDHTPPGALLLTPPDETGFRVFSERPIVGEWKDGTQQYFSDAYAFEWWSRMQTLGPNGGFSQLGEASLLDVAARYGARYLVFPNERPLRFPRLYENAEYVVYRLDRPAS